ncbi:MAG TPA: nucleotidyltransferase family protein [Caulobacteraceae bacterium]
MKVMGIARAMELPDWLLFSGAIYQPVWNHLTCRPADHGVKDDDLGYFDDADLSWEAEDAVIKRVAAACPGPLRGEAAVCNQARVHLWFEHRFGVTCDALGSSADALRRFASPAFAVGARRETDDRLAVFAPFGLEDLFAMRIRPNPLRRSAGLAKKIAGARARWPEPKVEE